MDQLYYLKNVVTIAWETCCLPRSYGGLSIRNLKVFNEALLYKLTWKFHTKENFLRDRYKSEYNKLYYTISSIWSSIQTYKDHILPNCS